MTIFTAPIDVSMLERVAQRVLAQAGDDPLAVADTLVLLPNRRACLALRELFVRMAQAEKRALLLPVMLPIGTVDEEEWAAAAVRHVREWAALPPAISPIQRLLVIAQELHRSQEALPGVAMRLEQAMRMAQDVIALMDELDREQVLYDALLGLRPDAYAEHWQQSLAAVKHVLRWWPDYLAQHGLLNPLDRRNRLIAALADYWQKYPPAHKVLVAGSTGSQPATARLLKVVAGLPDGEVILPGVDVAISPEQWGLMEPTHPQYVLRQVLERMEASRDTVGWMGDAECFQPWFQTFWPLAEQRKSQPLAVRIDCAREWEEAQLVSLLIREAIEAKQTVALVTQDETLARRVECVLGAMGVRVNNAAGQPALHAPVVQWALLVADCAVEAQSSLALLAMLKHVCCGGIDDALIDVIEKKVCRILRKPGDVLDTVAQLPAQMALAEVHLDGIELLCRTLRPLQRLCAQGEASLADLVQAHVGVLDALGAGWQDAAEDEMVQLVQQLLETIQIAGTISPRDYPDMLRQCLASHKYFPDAEDKQAHVQLLSPIEARLLHFDRMILGGLNEESWPRRVSPGHWLNEAMRQAVGLPPGDVQIGQSAHDFLMLLAAGAEVFVTRSKRSGGVDTLPSRWLVRMGMRGLLDEASGAHYLGWVRQWQQVDESVTCERPKAVVSPALMPDRLAVTQVDLLLRDPYGYYAKNVLKLSPLDPLDPQPDARLRGSVLHKILEVFVHAVNEDEQALNEAQFRQCARDVLAEYRDWPQVRLFWTPRMEQMGRWMVALERERRKKAVVVRSEQQVERVWRDGEAHCVVHGRIDRVEEDAQGRVSLVDYKTKDIPAQQAIWRGYGAQMPVLAWLMEQADVGELMYWVLGEGIEAPEVKYLAINRKKESQLPELLALYTQGVERLLQRYWRDGAAFVAIPNEEYAPKYHDYGHLERVAEWSGADEG